MVTIIFDLETSGLNPYHDDIIEIGAKVYNGENSFQILIKPKSERPISKKITEITGITNRQLRAEGHAWQEAYAQFYNWLFEATDNGSLPITLVSHNGDTFDFVFFKRMYHEFKKENEITLDIANIIYNDTLPFSKRLYPGRTYYNQPSLARTFNIMVDGAHRAMADVIVLEQLYTRLLNDLRIKEKVDGLKEPEKVRDYISFSTKY